MIDSAFFMTDTSSFEGRGGFLLKQGIGGSGLGPLLITESLQKCSKGLNFSYIDHKLSITSNIQNTPNIIFDDYEWTKLIFGACKLKLLNGYVGDKNENILSILFTICSPQFLYLDEL